MLSLNPETPHQHTMIWLHGLGASGRDFLSIAAALQLPPALGMRFVFPDAPMMPVTLNQGYIMRAWFDVYALTKNASLDLMGIERTKQWIHTLLAEEEAKGIPSHHIILAGFSQGAMMTLIAGLSYSKRLEGLVALSGFLPEQMPLSQEAHAANNQTPIFIGHGMEDSIVDYSLGEKTKYMLQDAQHAIAWHAYPNMAHTVSTEEIADLREWIIALN